MRFRFFYWINLRTHETLEQEIFFTHSTPVIGECNRLPTD